jgi:GNAT superfamily N-acetyltransferase
VADFTIRQAHPADAQHLGELAVQAYIHGGHLEPDSPYRETLQDASSRIAETYVAVDENGAILGAISLFHAGSAGTEIARDGEAEFRYLAIDPNAWGRNVGRALIAHVEELARQHDVTTMVIRVIDKNLRGLALYEHLGYQREPDRDLTLPPRVSACGVTNVTLLALRKSLISREARQ